MWNWQVVLLDSHHPVVKAKMERKFCKIANFFTGWIYLYLVRRLAKCFRLSREHYRVGMRSWPLHRAFQEPPGGVWRRGVQGCSGMRGGWPESVINWHYKHPHVLQHQVFEYVVTSPQDNSSWPCITKQCENRNHWWKGWPLYNMRFKVQVLQND